MIKYRRVSEIEVAVFLENKYVGVIKKDDNGLYRYWPDKSRLSGQAFTTLKACKNSLEEIWKK